MNVEKEYHDDWKSSGTGQKMERQFQEWGKHPFVHPPEFAAEFKRLTTK